MRYGSVTIHYAASDSTPDAEMQRIGDDIAANGTNRTKVQVEVVNVKFAAPERPAPATIFVFAGAGLPRMDRA